MLNKLETSWSRRHYTQFNLMEKSRMTQKRRLDFKGLENENLRYAIFEYNYRKMGKGKNNQIRQPFLGVCTYCT